MNWIKQNPFLGALGGATLAGAVILIVIGSRGGSRYQEALGNYRESSDEVARFERAPLFPDASLRDSKRKFISDYAEEIEALQAAFEPYRAADLETISAQEFTDRVVAAVADARAAFAATDASLPEGFFLGFEDYRAGTLARETATPILNYQLGAIRELVVSLGEAGPSELRNLHRPRLPEETGQSWQRADGQIARELPLEVTFKGNEESARKFLTAIASSKDHFYVIRSLRIGNEKQSPPLAADAKFEAAKTETPAAADTNPFGGFVFPDAFGDEEEGEDEPAAPADEPAEEPAPTATVSVPATRVAVDGDTSRILGQVLGSEEVYVFLRLDILQFLSPLELPQP